MIDGEIKLLVAEIEDAVATINKNMDILHQRDVEVRFIFKDPAAGNPPTLNLWRAVEHVNYLKTQD